MISSTFNNIILSPRLHSTCLMHAYQIHSLYINGHEKEQAIFLVTKETPIVREEETEQQRVI